MTEMSAEAEILEPARDIVDAFSGQSKYMERLCRRVSLDAS